MKTPEDLWIHTKNDDNMGANEVSEAETPETPLVGITLEERQPNNLNPIQLMRLHVTPIPQPHVRHLPTLRARVDNEEKTLVVETPAGEARDLRIDLIHLFPPHIIFHRNR